MSGETKFFFEEDAASDNSNQEARSDIFSQETEDKLGFSDIFGQVVEEKSGKKESMDGRSAMSMEIVSDLKEMRNSLLLIEYGTVGDDYVIHITPTHPTRNLQSDQKFSAALKKVVEEMNKHIPFDIRVDIHLPQKEWEIKATSFIARGAKTAWNVDIDDLNTKLIPVLFDGVTNICK